MESTQEARLQKKRKTDIDLNQFYQDNKLKA